MYNVFFLNFLSGGVEIRFVFGLNVRGIEVYFVVLVKRFSWSRVY